MQQLNEMQLQYPKGVQPLYLSSRIDAKLVLLGYEETQPDYHLSHDLEILYNQCIASVNAINSLLDGADDDLEAAAKAATDLRIGLDDARFHIRSSGKALHRLAEHCYGQLEDE